MGSDIANDKFVGSSPKDIHVGDTYRYIYYGIYLVKLCCALLPKLQNLFSTWRIYGPGCRLHIYCSFHIPLLGYCRVWKEHGKTLPVCVFLVGIVSLYPRFHSAEAHCSYCGIQNEHGKFQLLVLTCAEGHVTPRHVVISPLWQTPEGWHCNAATRAYILPSPKSSAFRLWANYRRCCVWMFIFIFVSSWWANVKVPSRTMCIRDWICHVQSRIT